MTSFATVQKALNVSKSKKSKNLIADKALFYHQRIWGYLLRHRCLMRGFILEEDLYTIGKSIVDNMQEESFKKYRKAGWNYVSSANIMNPKRLWWTFGGERHQALVRRDF